MSILFVIAVAVFVAWSSKKKGGFFGWFYKWVPSILLLYLLPAVVVNVGLLEPGNTVRLLAMDSALPLCFIILTTIIYLPDLLKISKPGLLTFLAGTLGIVIGGPLALAAFGIFQPWLVAEAGVDSVWKGLVCITGSWINGTPGQLSMKEIYGASEPLFLTALATDILLQNIWLFFLLYYAKFQNFFNKKLLGRTDFDHDLVDNEKLKKEAREPMHFPPVKVWLVLALTLAAVLFLSPLLAIFFGNAVDTGEHSAWSFLSKKSLWLVLLSTSLGLALSGSGLFQKNFRFWTGLGNGLLFFVIASIGMQLDLQQAEFKLSFLGIGALWLLIHLAILFLATKVFMPLGTLPPSAAKRTSGARRLHRWWRRRFIQASCRWACCSAF
jgi:uncharacterized membrane protein